MGSSGQQFCVLCSYFCGFSVVLRSAIDSIND